MSELRVSLVQSEQHPAPCAVEFEGVQFKSRAVFCSLRALLYRDFDRVFSVITVRSGCTGLAGRWGLYGPRHGSKKL